MIRPSRVVARISIWWMKGGVGAIAGYQLARTVRPLSVSHIAGASGYRYLSIICLYRYLSADLFSDLSDFFLQIPKFGI